MPELFREVLTARARMESGIRIPENSELNFTVCPTEFRADSGFPEPDPNFPKPENPNVQPWFCAQKFLYIYSNFVQLTIWVNENEALSKQIGGLGENAERFNLLRKKTFSNKGSNTILMDETPLHYKRFSVGSHHTPTPFKNISPKNSSSSSASGIHQPVAQFTQLSKSVDSGTT